MIFAQTIFIKPLGKQLCVVPLSRTYFIVDLTHNPSGLKLMPRFKKHYSFTELCIGRHTKAITELCIGTIFLLYIYNVPL